MRVLMRPAGPADPIEGDAPSGRSALMLQHQRHREYASKARQAGIIAMLKPMLWYYGEHWSLNIHEDAVAEINAIGDRDSEFARSKGYLMKTHPR